jgi:Rrf2 family protein
MKLITRDTDYALRAICFIAKNKEKVVSVGELVAKLKIPRPFLRKILQVLNKKKILKSYKGLGGGFILLKPANKIFLIELMKIFQGPLSLNECYLKKMKCPKIKVCPLRKKLDKIEKFMINELESITIGSLLKKE